MLLLLIVLVCKTIIGILLHTLVTTVAPDFTMRNLLLIIISNVTLVLMNC